MSTTAPLDVARFTKVQALHDGTDKIGERKAAAGRLEALARAAGMTIAEAATEASRQSTAAQDAAELLNSFFNSTDFGAERLKRERDWQLKAAAVVKEYGSEDNVFADTLMEAALRKACTPLLGQGHSWDGINYELDGWGTLGSRARMPSSVRQTVSHAWPLPDCVAAAWAEFQATERLASDRGAVCPDYLPHLFSDARRYVIEDLLTTLPAQSLNDVRARLAWLEFWSTCEVDQEIEDHRATLATLRADIERMAARIPRTAGAME